jgi:hypothetical protein
MENNRFTFLVKVEIGKGCNGRGFLALLAKKTFGLGADRKKEEAGVIQQ